MDGLDTCVAIAWSGGKDSACAYDWAIRHGCRVCCLLSAIQEAGDLVEFHGVRAAVLDAQAEAMGLKLFSRSHSGGAARTAWLELLRTAQRLGATACVFGDHFSSETRRAFYESVCAEAGLDLITPLVGISAQSGMQAVIAANIESVVVACDPLAVPRDVLGGSLDAQLIHRLEECDGMDPSGNHGEYHTLVLDAPFFSRRLEIVGTEEVQLGRYLTLSIGRVDAVQKPGAPQSMATASSATGVAAESGGGAGVP